LTVGKAASTLTSRAALCSWTVAHFALEDALFHVWAAVTTLTPVALTVIATITATVLHCWSRYRPCLDTRASGSCGPWGPPSCWSIMVTMKIMSSVPAGARHCPVVGKHPDLNHVWLVVVWVAFPAVVGIVPLCACPLAPLIHLQQSFRFSRSVIVGQSVQVLLMALLHLLGAARATLVNGKPHFSVGLLATLKMISG